VTPKIASLYRYPLKGFTPEPLQAADLQAGRGLPWDRAFAVEDGPSGFDPEAPAHLSKMKFTVLARLPSLARIRTRFDDATQTLHWSLDGQSGAADMASEAGRTAFAEWLTGFLGADARGALRVLPGPGAYRFYDHPEGAVSLINLASVAELGGRLGRSLDPLRFRANLYVEGLPAWAEQEWVGCRLRLGALEMEEFSSTVRCAATHVSPDAGERDVEITKALWELYGRRDCGIYLRIAEGGRLAKGDPIALI